MDFSDMCRLCLCVETTTMLMSLNDDSENLIDKIHTISKVKVNAEDGLPAQVCQECINLVNICYNFKLQVEKSDMILKHHVSIIQETSHEQGSEGESKKVIDIPSDVADIELDEENEEEDTTSDSSEDEEMSVKEECSSFANPSYDEIQPTETGTHENGSESLTGENINSTDPVTGDEEEIGLVPTSNIYDGNKTNLEVRTKSEKQIEKTVLTSMIPHSESSIYLQSSLWYEDLDVNKKTCANIIYHECEVCGKSVKNLSLHMKLHTGEKPFQCDICGQRFSQRGSFYKHQMSHTGERPCKCPLCGKSFMCKSDLSQHNKLHTEDFKCSFCDKVCANRQGLEMHVRIHTGEKPFLCHTCGMHFSQKGGLTKHAMVHANVRPFPCSICKKHFISQSSLTKHFRIHTGEKPYTCATCEKSFTDRGYFMRHLLIHSGEKTHFCSVCGKGFTQGINLKRHVRLHTGEKPFECANCGECFVLKRDLKRHTERLHNK